MKSVGIDIGSSSIKVVEVNSNSKGIIVSQFTESPFNLNPGSDHEIEIIEFIKGLVSTYDQETTRFVVGLRQEFVSVRLKTFPFNDRQKILKSLPFELEEDLPMTQDTAIYDAKIVRYLGNTAEVLAMVAPKHRIEAAIQKIRDTGIDIQLLSCEGAALANCFEAWNQPIPALPAPPMDIDSAVPERKIVMIAHVGHTRTIVCALENNLLLGVRSIFWGAKNIADSIARKYEIPFVEAIKEMQTKAFILASREGASYDQIVFSDTISSQVKELARELRISMLEFKSEFNGVVESVGLTGGASQILNLNAFLTQNLEVPVNRTHCLTNFNTLGFEKTNRVDSIISISLGLAIEGLKKPRNPAVNFMRGEFALENLFFKNLWERWKVPVQVGASLFVIFLIYGNLREMAATGLSEATSTRLEETAVNVARIPKKKANEDGAKKYIKEQKRISDEMKNFENIAKMNSALDILRKVNDAVPGKANLSIDVHKLVIQEDEVTFEGLVGSAQQFSSLEASLATIAQGRVNRISTSAVSNSTKKPGIPFAFGFKVDRGVTGKN